MKQKHKITMNLYLRKFLHWMKVSTVIKTLIMITIIWKMLQLRIQIFWLKINNSDLDKPKCFHTCLLTLLLIGHILDHAWYLKEKVLIEFYIITREHTHRNTHLCSIYMNQEKEQRHVKQSFKTSKTTIEKRDNMITLKTEIIG